MKTIPPRNSQSWTNAVSALALFFTQQLAEDVGPANMSSIATLNSKEKNPSICHSHDFIDANEVMSEAFLESGFPSPASSEAVDPRLEADLCDLWEAAWQKAKEMMKP